MVLDAADRVYSDLRDDSRGALQRDLEALLERILRTRTARRGRRGRGTLTARRRRERATCPQVPWRLTAVPLNSELRRLATHLEGQVALVRERLADPMHAHAHPEGHTLLAEVDALTGQAEELLRTWSQLPPAIREQVTSSGHTGTELAVEGLRSLIAGAEELQERTFAADLRSIDVLRRYADAKYAPPALHL
ncbi:hypothetical protein [Kineococcus sp. SYSU DK006]|uniref:hypothetical protein n=1 Tax=Kineococcus sp. SYSU DK006 TaxID=3383127 RepID=UPI003D7F02C5